MEKKKTGINANAPHRTAGTFAKNFRSCQRGCFPRGEGGGGEGEVHESCQCIQCFPRWKKTKPQRNATHRIADLCSRHANDDDDAGVLKNWGAGGPESWRRGGAGEAYRRDGATHGIEFEAFIYFFCEGDGGGRSARKKIRRGRANV